MEQNAIRDRTRKDFLAGSVAGFPGAIFSDCIVCFRHLRKTIRPADERTEEVKDKKLFIADMKLVPIQHTLYYANSLQI